MQGMHEMKSMQQTTSKDVFLMEQNDQILIIVTLPALPGLLEFYTLKSTDNTGAASSSTLKTENILTHHLK